MKKLLLISLLALPITVAAQSTTNVTYRIQVESVTAGVTNTVAQNWRFDAGGSGRDKARLAGLHFAYGNYVNAQGTNTVLNFGPWLRQQHTALVDDYANQKQAADNTTLAQKIATLLTSQSDLLSNADINNLNTIAAKLP